MIEFEIVHQFRVFDLDRFWREYLEEEFHVAIAAPLGFARREVLERRERDGEIHQTVRFTPDKQPPRFVRKLLSGDSRYYERSIFHRSDRRLEIDIELPPPLGNRSHLAGVFTVEQVREGLASRSFAGELSVRVPLLGRRIEKYIVGDMTRSYGIEAEFITDWFNAPRRDPSG